MEVVSTTDQAGGDSGDQCCGVDQWLPACPTSHLLNNILIQQSTWHQVCKIHVSCKDGDKTSTKEF